jgi:hypothetical protein
MKNVETPEPALAGLPEGLLGQPFTWIIHELKEPATDYTDLHG